MMQAGQIRIKLTQSDLEMLVQEKEEKEREVKSLQIQLEVCKEELKKEEQTQQQHKIDAPPSQYATTTMPTPTTMAMERHMTEQMVGKLASKKVKLKLKLAEAEYEEQKLKSQILFLDKEIKELKSMRNAFVTRHRASSCCSSYNTQTEHSQLHELATAQKLPLSTQMGKQSSFTKSVGQSRSRSSEIAPVYTLIHRNISPPNLLSHTSKGISKPTQRVTRSLEQPLSAHAYKQSVSTGFRLSLLPTYQLVSLCQTDDEIPQPGNREYTDTVPQLSPPTSLRDSTTKSNPTVPKIDSLEPSPSKPMPYSVYQVPCLRSEQKSSN